MRLLVYLFCVTSGGVDMLAGMAKGRIGNSIIVFIRTLFHVRYSPRTRAVAAGQYSILTYFVPPVVFLLQLEDDDGPVM